MAVLRAHPSPVRAWEHEAEVVDTVATLLYRQLKKHEANLRILIELIESSSVRFFMPPGTVIRWEGEDDALLLS